MLNLENRVHPTEKKNDLLERTISLWVLPKDSFSFVESEYRFKFIKPDKKGTFESGLLKCYEFVRNILRNIYREKNYYLFNLLVHYVRSSLSVCKKYYFSLFFRLSKKALLIERQSSRTNMISEEQIILADQAIVKLANYLVFPKKNQSCVVTVQNHFVFPEMFVSKVEDAKVYGGSNLVFTKNTVICHDLYDFNRDLTSEELHNRIKISGEFQRIRLLSANPTAKLITIAATFLDACAPNYAHWLTEVLPRICMFCSDKRFDGIPIIINGGLHENLMASLFLVVGKERDIIVLPIGCALEVERLLVTSPCGYIPFDRRPGSLKGHLHGLFSSDAFCLLQEKLLQKIVPRKEINFPKKIYLRRNSSVRNVTNEAEIEKILIIRGFAVIEPEKLSFTQQVELFQKVDIVVSPTGASCANLIFCKPEVKVVIFMAVHADMPYRYWLNMLSAAGKTNINYILGEVVQRAWLGVHGNYEIKGIDLEACLALIDSDSIDS